MLGWSGDKGSAVAGPQWQTLKRDETGQSQLETGDAPAHGLRLDSEKSQRAAEQSVLEPSDLSQLMCLLLVISLVGPTADIDNESVTATNIPGDDGSSWLAATGENHRSGVPIRAQRRSLSIANCEAGEVRAMIDWCIWSRLCRRGNPFACGERLFAEEAQESPSKLRQEKAKRGSFVREKKEKQGGRAQLEVQA
ncbi:hypothetical protein BJY00DRAFT_275653 [Aspergillus carlsbadensis]|nr:hypothetical protein BJY00DRAFT_275653 [Aspergillus carlsbadensis]